MTTAAGNGNVVVFAYGSNMLRARIQSRCRHARAVGVAELRDHSLAWHKRSSDGSGKCDIVAGGDSVFGVIYEVPLSEKPGLDSAEGLGAGYEEHRVAVLHEGILKEAIAYVATKIDGSLRPYSWYRDIVAAGAKEHGLPDDYVRRIQAVEAIEDPDRQRHESNLALLYGVEQA